VLSPIRSFTRIESTLRADIQGPAGTRTDKCWSVEDLSLSYCSCGSPVNKSSCMISWESGCPRGYETEIRVRLNLCLEIESKKCGSEHT
jgi:hypothetical protein